jgi:hypothetical protein
VFSLDRESTFLVKLGIDEIYQGMIEGFDRRRGPHEDAVARGWPRGQTLLACDQQEAEVITGVACEHNGGHKHLLAV